MSEQVIHFPTGEPGHYQVVVSGFEGTVGDFVVAVERFEATELSVGDSVSGMVDGPGEVAAFEFEAVAGESYAVTVEPDAALDAILTVVDPSGVAERVDALPEDGDEQAIRSLGEPGRYRIVVSGYAGTIGSFALSVSPFEATELSVGDTTSGAVSGTGDVAVFEFDATAGEVVAVTVDPDATLDAAVMVLDPSEVPVRVDVGIEDEPERVIPAGGAQGRYQVVVSGYGGTSGGFALTVAPADVAALTVGESTPGTISGAGDARVFEFDVAAGGPVTVVVDPDQDLDAVLTVLDPSGAPVYMDGSSEGESEQVVTSDEGPGHYRVVVSGFASTAGSFDLIVTST